MVLYNYFGIYTFYAIFINHYILTYDCRICMHIREHWKYIANKYPVTSYIIPYIRIYLHTWYSGEISGMTEKFEN